MSDAPCNLTQAPQHERILSALKRHLSDESIISLQFGYDAPPARTAEDDWFRLQCLLSQPLVYQAFGVRRLALRFPFRKVHGFEAVGSLANLLAEGGIHGDFVPNAETAFAESKAFLDILFAQDYSLAEGYVIEGGWCEWFIDEGMLDKTLLVGKGNAWWLLAITSTD